MPRKGRLRNGQPAPVSRTPASSEIRHPHHQAAATSARHPAALVPIFALARRPHWAHMAFQAFYPESAYLEKTPTAQLTRIDAAERLFSVPLTRITSVPECAVSSVGFLWGSATVSQAYGASVGLAEALVCPAFPIHGARVSSSRLSYRPYTRRDTVPHPGHAADEPHVLAWMRTDLPAVKTCSTSTPVRCGSSTSATSRSHDQNRHRRRTTGPTATPRDAITKTVRMHGVSDVLQHSWTDLRHPDRIKTRREEACQLCSGARQVACSPLEVGNLTPGGGPAGQENAADMISRRPPGRPYTCERTPEKQAAGTSDADRSLPCHKIRALPTHRFHTICTRCPSSKHMVMQTSPSPLGLEIGGLDGIGYRGSFFPFCRHA